MAHKLCMTFYSEKNIQYLVDKEKEAITFCLLL